MTQFSSSSPSTPPRDATDSRTRHRAVASLRRASALFGLAVAFHAMDTFAQDYPNRAVRLIVPYTAGGGTDILARVIGKGLSEKWKQPVVVENKPGGDATIGIDIAAHAEPDGYTLAMVLTTHAVQASLKSGLPYDLLRDFAPITELAEVPSVLVVSNKVNAKSVAELVELARKEPGRLTFAGTGTGGPAHLAAELFNSLAGIKTLHVPYKGGSQALTDLMGAQVDFMFTTALAGLPAIQSGRVKALAVTGARRTSILLDVPTMDEAGVKGYNFVTWYGVVTRKGTPNAIVQKVSADIRDVVNAPEAGQTLAKEGAQVVASSPEVFAQYLDAEVRQWATVVRNANLKSE